MKMKERDDLAERVDLNWFSEEPSCNYFSVPTINNHNAMLLLDKLNKPSKYYHTLININNKINYDEFSWIVTITRMLKSTSEDLVINFVIAESSIGIDSEMCVAIYKAVDGLNVKLQKEEEKVN